MTELGRRAFHQLHEAAALLTEDTRVSMARRGLTAARANLLWLLSGGPRTQRDLAEALGVTPRNITGLVDALVADGFVARATHPEDRRAHLVSLSPTGQDAVAWMVESEQRAVDLVYGAIPAPELAAYVETTEAVLAALRAHAIRPLPEEEHDA